MDNLPFLMKTNRRRTPKMYLCFANQIFANNENVQAELKNNIEFKKKLFLKEPSSSKKKIRRFIEPVQESTWRFDFFDEIDYLYDKLRKEKIKRLKMRCPVEECKWKEDEMEWMVF